MPGFYPEDEYDLAGFCVGVVNKDKILDKESVRPGDVILGLASSGVHSNGFSLVRKVFDIRRENLPALTAYDEKLGKSLLDALLTPTRIYVQSVLPLLTQVNVRSICHITAAASMRTSRAPAGGVSASIQKSSYSVPPIFRKIQQRATSRSATCTTPSTWAPVWFWPLPLRTLPARLQQFPLQASRLMLSASA